MRDIKFRGKSTHANQWVYGSLIKKRHGIADWYIQDDSGVGSDVITDTIGQFTGLKDKNGNDIYEGDVIEYKYQDDLENYGFGVCYGYVSFEKSSFVVKQKGFDYEKAKYEPCTLYSWINDEKCELIGNIHENTTP
jgi:uncharacterized phage protein (TIGR01671 family)